MSRYLKLYAWMWSAFGEQEFSIDDFRAVFPSPSPAKVLHDLVKLSFVERVVRGRYMVARPQRLLEGIVEQNLKQEDVLEGAEKKYAFCDSDAVNIWTEGYYWTGFTKGFKPIHIRALSRDLSYWKKFFSERDVEFAIAGEKKTMFGLSYILHPEEEVRVEIKEGIPVIPLREVVEFCLEHELTYRPALEYLDRKYGLKIYESHEHLEKLRAMY